MLVSYNWLKDYVDLNGVSPEALADKITKAGIEVEHVHAMSEGVKNIAVGHVVSCEQHPNADKLNLCQVDLGDETVQIVCGAPNVAKGQKVPVAKVGARLPGNIKIKRSKLRGETSNGMICSLSELGVDAKLVPKEFADGIYVFEEDAVVGENALSYLNLDDHVLELDILPNSAHCLNMIGVAYEVAAILNKDVDLPRVLVNETPMPAESKIRVNIEAKDAVPYYGARVIENINVKPSPQWLQNRLIAAGIRPISNIVDITNYVMLEYGQPLHAFDYERFGSDRVLVRHANDGEMITTLDDEERTLTTSDVVITNGIDPVAVAGVMGGVNSEVSSETRTVLLESAIFDALTVRKTASRLQMRTDASSRYEKKGIDRNRVAEAADRAAELIQTIAGGDVLSGIVEDGVRTVSPQVIKMPWQKVNDVLGTDLAPDTILSILSRLNFQAELNGDTLHASIPIRRPDVTIPEDLVEEVGRIYGYDHVPATLPEGPSTQGTLTAYQRKRRRVHRYFEGQGLQQAITYSLTTGKKASELRINNQGASGSVQLAMPMSEERSTLRMSIVPQLIEVVQYHLNRQMGDVKLYEIGKIFIANEEKNDLPIEREHVAGIFTGSREERIWEGQPLLVDYYTVKGVLEGLFNQLDVLSSISFKPAKRDGLHPGRTADIYLNNKVIGYLGQLHPNVQKANDLQDTFVFECDLQSVLNVDMGAITYKALPRYPSITRDIALVVKEDVKAGELYDVIRTAGGSLLNDIQLFDVYQGEHLEEGQKSLAFSLKYLDPERTLTDKEINQTHEDILNACQDKLGAVLRG
ncbi:phenylalanyl-tRNA synthetase beta subunit [Scopulibacillus darangshiensis]|uniref:Phenylalanine--tRNA ligase beta subunit n=1 Tax=Scopulibacillus darangshiensis TaxID=442528 RepID=A0A4R2PAL7_9BACL|nr:phenylalanine--tRNA ligase subunit beta [Scopulibacillus darangshiensis]TCP32123.1 phenylalanyl-tRNA synthetase beta subunit [Scopulibacillus darangshiensis]